MSGVETENEIERSAIALKIVYTLHGIDSQKFIVKPAERVEAKVFRDLELGIVDIRPCLDAIREVSPDFSSICATHGDEYAVYSADYGEEGLPLQSHGKLSQEKMCEVTGKLSLSKLMKEQLELLIHLLPVRKPEDMIADFYQRNKVDTSNASDPIGNMMNNEAQSHARNIMPFPAPPASFMNSAVLPPLPPQVQIPPSLASGSSMKSDSVLPSSPPMRAKPSRINTFSMNSGSGSHVSSLPSSAASSALVNDPSGINKASDVNVASHTGSASSNGAKRIASEHSGAKKRKALSPKSDNEAQCGNCGVVTASTWRRARCPDGKGELLCNACGLYYRAKKVMRPRFLWDKMRSRSDQDHASLATTENNGAIESSSSTLNTSSSQFSLKPGRVESVSTPQDTPQMLWSQDHSASANYLTSDPADLSDRLVDHPSHSESTSMTHTQASASLPETNNQRQSSRSQSKIKKRTQNAAFEGNQGNQGTQGNEREQEQQLLPPSTPDRKSSFVPLEPDSMQKLLGLSTPDQKFSFMIPGSESARKWLDKALSTTNFEEIWNSPTPRKTRLAIPDLAMFTSSPPTSSNMLSEVAEWNLANGSPGTPHTLKFLRDSDPELTLESGDNRKITLSTTKLKEESHSSKSKPGKS